MGRSLKKGPFIADSLLKKVEKQNTKLGEFAPTRTYRGHIRDKKGAKS